MSTHGIIHSFVAAALVLIGTAAHAQIVIPSANLGTDGAFNPFQNRLVTLGTAITGQWDQPGTGVGVYDAEKWAVVFKYTTVSIPLGVTVTFANHPSGAPVVWLVSGDVTINGTVNLAGVGGGSGAGFPAGGPGGFGGGQGVAPTTGGRGPGGGGRFSQPLGGDGGGFGTFGETHFTGEVGGHVYGTADLVPLVGGSGGAGSAGQRGGGGGGGILIVSTGTITVNGIVAANGGSGTGNNGGGGSGGAIRLVSNVLTGVGSLSAVGGPGYNNGGFGRIRTEANTDSLPTLGNPDRSRAAVGTTARLWPESTEPSIIAVSLGDRPVPTDPRGLFTFGNADVELNSTTPAILDIHARNVPLNSLVEIRIVPVTQGQNEIRVPAAFQSGTVGFSVWRATLPVSNGVSAFTVGVTLP